MKNIPQQPLLFFDGVCNLCNSSVQYIIKHDKNNQFTFASLQSDAVKNILLQFEETNSKLDSILLIHNDKIYSKSSAILRVAKILGGFHKMAYFFIVIPKPLRNWMYDFIAKNRYKWFGQRESCMVPSSQLKNRFLS
ncbi:thiol-disulfide oxidoreductase DCC family protein [Urechidicola croceus]|uniref:Thiol-disulfide oxidoreductase n=1 Tax=Urechidicola croceus TaxID=1850246 RepID=A0A1D8P4I8_9FLAO|nr:DUF393 domain-containing protein [Urechidicola croceus]AOW19466.1 thiol-disulfide oxidoreductase [Urechidicola croceus]